MGESGFMLGQAIVNKIDSVYISDDKNKIYIVNDKNECLWIKPDYTVEKLDERPNVSFSNILNYHD